MDVRTKVQVMTPSLRNVTLRGLVFTCGVGGVHPAFSTSTHFASSQLSPDFVQRSASLSAMCLR